MVDVEQSTWLWREELGGETAYEVVFAILVVIVDVDDGEIRGIVEWTVIKIFWTKVVRNEAGVKQSDFSGVRCEKKDKLWNDLFHLCEPFAIPLFSTPSTAQAKSFNRSKFRQYRRTCIQEN